MPETRWWRFVSGILDGMSALEAGRKAGFDGSAFTRWKKGSSPDAAFVVKFARAFEANVLEALAAAEIITDDEAQLREVRVGGRRALREASGDALAEEVSQRLREFDVAREASVVPFPRAPEPEAGNAVDPSVWDEPAAALDSGADDAIEREQEAMEEYP